MNGQRHRTGTALLGFGLLYTLFFSPTLFSGLLLGLRGDAILYSVPAFYAHRSLWTPLLFSGFPLAADPQMMVWYPVAWLSSLLPIGLYSWNLFVITGYVLASAFTFGYVYRLTESSAASVASGLVYGMSGFLMVNSQYPHMVHSLAWLPLALWAIEELRSQFTYRWLSLLGMSIGLSALSGHPQTFLYALILVACYALTTVLRSGTANRSHVAAAVSGGMLLGLAIASILLLPMLELASYSMRSEISFQYFVTLSLRLDQLPVLIFPLLFGDGGNPGSSLETQGYVGLVSLALAFLGLALPEPSKIRMFWGGVALVSLVLALGAATPFAYLSFNVPVLNAFRGTARHFGEFSLAVAVLAGLGIASTERLTLDKRVRLVKRASFALAILSVVAFAAILIFRQAGHLGGTVDPVYSSIVVAAWKNFAIGRQVVLLGLGLAVLWVWSKRPTPGRSAALLCVLVLDLAHFGYYVTQAGYMAPMASAADVAQPATLDHYKAQLAETSHRLVPLRGSFEPAEAATPNLSRLWNIPSASGYGPLILRRYSELLGMSATGRLPDQALAPLDRSLDILSVKYLFAPPSPVTEELGFESHAMKWVREGLGISLGSDCNQTHPKNVVFALPNLKATHVGLITSLACSTSIRNGQPVARIAAVGPSGETDTVYLNAGVHTSEWAWDRRDVRSTVMHGHAPIFRSFRSADDDGGGFEGHQYVAVLPFKSSMTISQLGIEWLSNSGTISLIGISLKDEQTEKFYGLNGLREDLLEGRRWHQIANLSHARIFENREVLPRAWFVSRVQTLTANEILKAVHESKLRDGSVFDPREVALVEEPVDLGAPGIGGNAVIDSMVVSDTHVELDVKSDRAAFLILSDVYYPGWQAAVDGKMTRILQTNYVLRGVVVPPGQHKITMDFRPARFHAGSILTGLASIVSLVFLFKRPMA